MKKIQSSTDWGRVKGFEETAAIPYEPGDGPYDPNDADAARAWLAGADMIRKGRVVRRGTRGPQKAPTNETGVFAAIAEVVEHFRSTGPGWQNAYRQQLLKAIKKGRERRPHGA